MVLEQRNLCVWPWKMFLMWDWYGDHTLATPHPHLEVSLSTGTGNNKKIGDGRWKHVSTRHFHLHPTAVAALVQWGRTGEGIPLAELPHSSLVVKFRGSDYWRTCYQSSGFSTRSTVLRYQGSYHRKFKWLKHDAYKPPPFDSEL
jgi:hypothetical protein